MKILDWLDCLTEQPQPTTSEEDRQRRYEYGVREVQRWTSAKKAIAKDGADLTRRFDKKIAEHIREWGHGGEGLRILQWNKEAFQEQTEQQLQDAEYRLTFYRNIVLMQGRI